MQGDIRKWFMKSHTKGNESAPNPVANAPPSSLKNSPPAESQLEKPVNGGQASSGRRKTSKYFATDNQKTKGEAEVQTGTEKKELSAKRKTNTESDEPPPKPPPSKKLHKLEEDDDDFVPNTKTNYEDVTPSKKLKSGSGKGITKKPVDNDESDEDDTKDVKPPIKSGGRGRGGRATASTPAGGRGRGGGRGGFSNFGERKDPPHKGEKEVPEGSSDCLAGLTFVISGTLDSLEREEAEDLIKRHGGRVTGSISKKTNFLLCDEDIEGRKSSKAKELGTAFLTEDGLFDKIRASKSVKATVKEEKKNVSDKTAASLPMKSPQKAEVKSNSVAGSVARKGLTSNASPAKQTQSKIQPSSLPWTEKYRPNDMAEMIANPSLVTQLQKWLALWNEQFLNAGKGKKQNDLGSKKAVLLCGTPGIGKTTAAKLACQKLGFQAIEVNASDSRGKADAKISKGIGGSNANSIKELVSNGTVNTKMDRSKHPKTVLIMDEVDGMSAGDRGGVADLIASIKISKIPIICICNDRYSQKLKSLVNYCLVLTFRKPTKQQMSKRLMHVASKEGLQVNEIALEELADRVNGDMRMALNQLQYMSLSMSVIKYDDIRQRLHSSGKDEDISPFAAVDKLLGPDGGKLRMDERINFCMSDPDLVPLIVQENYINYRPNSVSKDESGLKRLSLIARAAESIADGDIVNVQIRRYRQWQLSQTGSLASCIIPAALMHGRREIFEQVMDAYHRFIFTLRPLFSSTFSLHEIGERNFNRFGGWLGKNSTMGKNLRLLEDFHVHFLASHDYNMERTTLRLEYLTLLLKRLTDPLRVLPKDEAVKEVVEFMNEYSITQEDFDTLLELSKFQGRKNAMDGIPPAVKSALTRAYNEGSKSRLVKAADLVTIPGIRRAPKKRIAAILEQSVDESGDKNETLIESEEENASDTEDQDGTGDEKLQSKFQSLSSKGIQVEMELKGSGSGSKKSSAGRGKGRGGLTAIGRGKAGSESVGKKAAQSSGAGGKRKR